MKGEFSAIKHLFYKRFSAKSEGANVTMKGFSDFSRYEDMQELES